MDIEHDLQRALRRTPTPPDFAARVLARIAADDAPDRNRASGETSRGLSGGNGRRLLSPARWLAAAAAVVMVATGTFQYYEHQRTISEAERVKQEIRLALQITSEKLALAQQRVERSARDASR